MDYETGLLLIRLGAGATMLAFGIDQFLNPTPWADAYVPDWVTRYVSKNQTMRIHSVFNIVLGLLLLLGVWLDFILPASVFWWISILPFAFAFNWRIGMRDLAITLALVAVWILRG